MRIDNVYIIIIIIIIIIIRYGYSVMSDDDYDAYDDDVSYFYEYFG